VTESVDPDTVMDKDVTDMVVELPFWVKKVRNGNVVSALVFWKKVNIRIHALTTLLNFFISVFVMLDCTFPS